MDEVAGLLTDQVPDILIASRLAKTFKKPREYVIDLIGRVREEMAYTLESIPIAHQRAQVFSGVQRSFVDARLARNITGQLAATAQMANLLGLNAATKVAVAGAFGVMHGTTGPQMRELPLGTLGFNSPAELATRLGELENRLRESGMNGLLAKAPPIVDVPDE